MYKVAIIHGKTLVDGMNKEGKITYLPVTTEEEYHIVSVVNFLKNHYKDKETLQQLNYRHQIEVACYLFCLQGDIVFLNNRQAKSKQKGEVGVFAMPDMISEKQRSSLLAMGKTLGNYDNITIEYDLCYNDGLIVTNTLHRSGYDASLAIDTYLQMVYDKRNSVREKK